MNVPLFHGEFNDKFNLSLNLESNDTRIVVNQFPEACSVILTECTTLDEVEIVRATAKLQIYDRISEIFNFTNEETIAFLKSPRDGEPSYYEQLEKGNFKYVNYELTRFELGIPT